MIAVRKAKTIDGLLAECWISIPWQSTCATALSRPSGNAEYAPELYSAKLLPGSTRSASATQASRLKVLSGTGRFR